MKKDALEAFLRGRHILKNGEEPAAQPKVGMAASHG